MATPTSALPHPCISLPPPPLSQERSTVPVPCNMPCYAMCHNANTCLNYVLKMKSLLCAGNAVIQSESFADNINE